MPEIGDTRARGGEPVCVDGVCGGKAVDAWLEGSKVRDVAG